MKGYVQQQQQRGNGRKCKTEAYTPEFILGENNLVSKPRPLFSEDTSGSSNAICYTNTFS